MSISEQDFDTLKRLEEELWREATRFDRDFMERVLAPDFFEFGRSGRVYNRQEILGFERVIIDCLLPLPGFQVRLLSADTAQVTYTSVVTIGGETQWANRSSLWSRSAGGWQLRFHQGTATGPAST